MHPWARTGKTWAGFSIVIPMCRPEKFLNALLGPHLSLYAKNSKGEVFPHKRPILTISFTIRRMDIIGFTLAELPELVQ